MSRRKYDHHFSIDRGTWAAGKRRPECNKLLNEDGSRCCLGFYLQSCGATDEVMFAKSMPHLCRARFDVPDWLLDECNSSVAACGLAENNDKCSMDNKRRERIIAEKFAEQRIRVTFRGKY